VQHSILDAAVAAQVLAERRKADPLFQWVAHPKQRLFLGSTKPRAFFLAANRSGKSEALAACIASMLRFGRLNPLDVYSGAVAPVDEPRRVWIVGLSHTLLMETIAAHVFNNGYSGGLTHKPFIPDDEIEDFNIKRGVLTLKNGSLGMLHSCDSGREKFQAAAVDLIGFDEAPPLSIFKECAIRVAGGANRPLYIRMAATLLPPPGITTGVSWLYDQVVKPYEKGDHEHMDLFSASIRDNPHVSDATIKMLEAVYPAGSVDRQVRLEGKLIAQAFGAPAYASFHRNIHVSPKLGLKSIAPRLPLLFSFDVNVRPMTAVVAQDLGNRIVVLDEIYINKSTGASIGELAQEFRRRVPAHGAEIRIYGDATSNHLNAQTTKTDYDMLLNEFSGYPAPVIPYIPISNPFVHDRVNSVNFALRGPNGSVNLEMAAHCKELIADMEEVQKDPKNNGILKSRDAGDPYYYRTHISDALGYLVWAVRPVNLDDRSTRRRGLVQRDIPSPTYQFGRKSVPQKSRQTVGAGSERWM
jgi:phage terminase large subunit-like protein